MFSVILYMLRQTLGHRAPPLPFLSFFPAYCDVSQALSYFASTIRENTFTSGTNDLLKLVTFVLRRRIRADDEVTRP
jgi:hypothetical protein